MTEASSLTPEDRIRRQFPDAVLEATLAVDVPTLVVDPAQVEAVARYVKDELGYKMPVLATGIDRKDSMEVVWHVLHVESGQFLGLRVRLDRDEPQVASLAPVWAGMDWHEREAFDLLGIMFDGHPDLRRILLPDDWEGFPLRKDYTAID